MELRTLLASNSYPGRGIVAGRCPDNSRSVLLYFITGRSEGSKNRTLVLTEDGVRTQAANPELLDNPSLFQYNAVRTYAGETILTNGDQTDTIYEYLKQGKSFEQALETRKYEPDPPLYTPRISCLLSKDGSYRLSILKTQGNDPLFPLRQFFHYPEPKAGYGHLLHTYKIDGTPVPPFEGEPRLINIPDDIEAFLDEAWNALRKITRVAMYMRVIQIEDGSYTDYVRNREQSK